MRRWFQRQYHGICAAYWTNQIEVARVERDWIYLSHAIDRRNHHETALVHEVLR